MGDAVHDRVHARVFINDVSVQIKRITEFMTKFERSSKYRLAELNEKLNGLERKLEVVEHTLSTAKPAEDVEGEEDILKALIADMESAAAGDEMAPSM